jgi:glycosyltransferase involved in cell wall biosynthesis
VAPVIIDRAQEEVVALAPALRALERAIDSLTRTSEASADAIVEQFIEAAELASASIDNEAAEWYRARLECLGVQTPHAMAGLMGRASIFAHPARYEPFGLSVLEAALSGCALVVGDIEMLRENWSGAARFVSPDDPRALRTAISELIENPGERESLAAAARRRAELFSPEQHRDRYYSLYLEMMEARAGSVTRPAAIRP